MSQKLIYIIKSTLQLVWSCTVCVVEVFSICLFSLLEFMLDQDFGASLDITAGLDFAVGFEQ